MDDSISDHHCWLWKANMSFSAEANRKSSDGRTAALWLGSHRNWNHWKHQKLSERLIQGLFRNQTLSNHIEYGPYDRNNTAWFMIRRSRIPFETILRRLTNHWIQEILKLNLFMLLLKVTYNKKFHSSASNLRNSKTFKNRRIFELVIPRPSGPASWFPGNF